MLVIMWTHLFKGCRRSKSWPPTAASPWPKRTAEIACRGGTPDIHLWQNRGKGILDNFKNYGCGLQRIKWEKIRDIGGGPQDLPLPQLAHVSPPLNIQPWPSGPRIRDRRPWSPPATGPCSLRGWAIINERTEGARTRMIHHKCPPYAGQLLCGVVQHAWRGPTSPAVWCQRISDRRRKESKRLDVDIDWGVITALDLTDSVD